MAELRYSTQSGSRAEVDQGLKSYMLGVYNYMGLGIGVAALIVLASFTIPALGDVTKALGIPAFIAMVALGWFGPRMVMNGSIGKAHVVYWAYVAAWGIGIAPLVMRYLGVQPSIVMSAFLTTAITFGSMSFWGYTTKKDLSGMGHTVIMALWGVFIASIVNLGVAMFFGLSSGVMMFSMALSAVFVVLVALLTAWETQMVKEMYDPSDLGETATRKSVLGAFMLYGSFVSMFANILQLMGFLGGDD